MEILKCCARCRPRCARSASLVAPVEHPRTKAGVEAGADRNPSVERVSHRWLLPADLKLQPRMPRRPTLGGAHPKPWARARPRCPSRCQMHRCFGQQARRRASELVLQCRPAAAKDLARGDTPVPTEPESQRQTTKRMPRSTFPDPQQLDLGVVRAGNASDGRTSLTAPGSCRVPLTCGRRVRFHGIDGNADWLKAHRPTGG